MEIGYEAIVRMVDGDTKKGVHVNDVDRRRDLYGSNARPKKQLRTVWQILCQVLEDPMLRILLVASIATIIINEIVEVDDRDIAWIDGVAIFVAVFVVCAVSTFNDYRKERQFNKLSEEADVTRTVLPWATL